MKFWVNKFQLLEFFIFFFLFLLGGCNNNCNEITKTFENIVWTPKNYSVIDCKLKEDIIADSGTEEILIIKLESDDYERFIKNNKLDLIRNTRGWGYAPKNFYDRILNEKNLKCPTNLKIEETFYLSERKGDHSIECIFDINTGYFIANLSSD